jgi:hypothetical protein
MANRVVRLAQLLDLKHKPLLAAAKQNILDAFTYHFSDGRKGPLSKNPKGSIFRALADAGDPMMVKLTYKMDKLVSTMDNIPPNKLLDLVNDLLTIMYQIKNDPDRSVRNNIRTAFRGHSEAAIKHHLSRFEDSVTRSFSLLQKAGSYLQKLDPEAMVHGGSISPQRGDLTSQEILTFVQRTPTFKSFGLDSMEIIEKILQDPELKSLLTTVINAVNRGVVPADGFAMQTAAAKIKARLDQKNSTNQLFFESNDPLPPSEKVKDEE